MEINEFVKKFAEQFDDTEENEIFPKCRFKDLDEWSSLTALAIIAFVRTEYKKKITASDIRSCDTVEDLFILVENR